MRIKGLLMGIIPVMWWLAAKYGGIGLWYAGSAIVTEEDRINAMTNFLSMVHVWWGVILGFELAILIAAIWLIGHIWSMSDHPDDHSVALGGWVATAGWVLIRLGWYWTDTDQHIAYDESSDWTLLTGLGWGVMVLAVLFTAITFFGPCLDRRHRVDASS